MSQRLRLWPKDLPSLERPIAARFGYGFYFTRSVLQGATAGSRPAMVLACSHPYLIPDDCHHKQKVESKCPEDEEFRTFEVPPRDKVLFRPSQLIMFERR